MKKNNVEYKKGMIVHVTYHSLGNKVLMQSLGIIYKNSNKNIYLGHNLEGTKLIDKTRIPIENIISIKHISPLEINSMSDLN